MGRRLTAEQRFQREATNMIERISGAHRFSPSSALYVEVRIPVRQAERAISALNELEKEQCPQQPYIHRPAGKPFGQRSTVHTRRSVSRKEYGMGMKELEAEILKEARKVTGNDKLQMKAIAEWSTSEIEPKDEEILVYLPDLKVYCAIRIITIGKSQ